MIFSSLSVYSFKRCRVLRKYDFNKFGVNIILGDKREKEDETNGVGKTAMIDSLQFLLGRSITKEYYTNEKILEENIFLILEADIEGRKIFLGRLFSTPKKGYILHGDKLTFALHDWNDFPDKKYKEEIHAMFLGEEQKDITFATLREYLIRDEKKGFAGITLPDRKPIISYMCLAFLFDLPYNAEKEIKEIGDNITTIATKIKLIESFKKDLNELKIREGELKKELLDIEKAIHTVNPTEQYEKISQQYTTHKSDLNDIQKKIFELEYITKQYKTNIRNLETKRKGIQEFNDINKFYEQLLGYFPRQLKKNYEEVLDFYNFMVENRGVFFKEKIEAISDELSELHGKKRELQMRLEDDSRMFSSIHLVDDVSFIVEEKRQKEQELAEISIRIKDYSQINELNDQINTLQRERLRLTALKNDIFHSYKNVLDIIGGLFNDFVRNVYNQTGVLDFEFDNRIDDKKKTTTGRIKISCSIPDQNSHGRYHMMINFFDLTWFVNRLQRNKYISFLVHDGSYSTPDPSVKIKLLTYVEYILRDLGKGQYFVTLNKPEVDPTDLSLMESMGCIVAKLERGNNNEDRFMGIRF